MSFYHEPNVQHEDNFFRDEIDDFHDAKERVRGFLFFLTNSSTKHFFSQLLLEGNSGSSEDDGLSVCLQTDVYFEL